MIAALLFFSVSGAVILRVFAAAHVRAGENAARDSAILCAQSVAEAYSVSADPKAACARVFGAEPRTDGETLVLELDGNCRPSGNAAVTLSLTENREPTAAGTLCRLSMTFSAASGELFSLDCSAYVPEKGGAADES